ncbi:MAG: ABC transporter ATP-binding protein [Planctomycetota bacterium]
MTSATTLATPPDRTTIEGRNLSIEFSGRRQADQSVRAVNQANFRIVGGEMTSIIGPSGCGKTTLLRAIAGLQPITGGELHVNPAVHTHRGEVAFVFQSPALLPWLSAIENVMLPLELLGQCTQKERRHIAQETLNVVGLADAIDQRPQALSGGMKMRVSIARAMVTSPRVLLLDEPFAALDDMLRSRLGELIREIWQQRGLTIALVTHNIAEAILMSDQILVMREGRVEKTIENPLERPRHDAMQTLAQFGAFYGQVNAALRGEQA